MMILGTNNRFIATVLSAFVAIASTRAEKAAKPNFIVIMTDDQGVDDYGFRQPPLETPNMDKIMKEGVQFTRFYTGSSCAPTRSQLMTGRNFFRTGTASVGFGGDAPHLDEYLVGQALQDAGYVTGMVGKWNLGTSDAELPHRRGFNETWEVTGLEVRTNGKYDHFNAPFTHNGEYQGILEGWQVERVTEKALDFIQENKDDPFFLYIPYSQPHEPWLCPKELQQKYMDKGISESYAMFLGMMEQIDSQVGRVLNAVETHGLSDDTIVMFFGDNGPTPKTRLLQQKKKDGKFFLTGGRYEMIKEEWDARNPTGLRSKKATGWENAVRNRLGVYCPARFNAKVVKDEMTVVYDIYPTLLNLAGHFDAHTSREDYLPFDGRSFGSLLVDDDAEWPKERGYLMGQPGTPYAKESKDGWHYRFTKKHSLPVDSRSTAFLLGYWVVVNDEGVWGLFDLSKDPKQLVDLKETRPRKFRIMRKAYFAALSRIREDPHAWSDPVQVVGFPDIEKPYLEMYYAFRYKGINKVSWFYTFFRELGAVQESKIRVLKSAKYNVELRALGVPPGTKIEFRVGRRTRTVSLNEGEKMHKLGRFKFKKGEDTIGMTVLESDDLDLLRRMKVYSLLLTKVSD